MTEELKNKLVKIVKDNSKWPLIIEGVSASNFPSAINLPSITPSQELGVIPSENQLIYPAFAKELIEKSKTSKRNILCISNMDKISEEEQEKFYGLIKHRGINGYKFPEDTQIIITTKKGGIEKISKRILSLALCFKME